MHPALRPAYLGTLLGTLLATPPASAAEGLYLTWNDCALGISAASIRGFACNADFGQQALYCALVMAQPTDSVLGVEIVVDVQHAAPALPDWWHFEVGGCRAGQLVADDNFGLANCQDLWQGQASGGLQSYTVGMPRGGANQARIRVALSVPSTQPRALNATDMYYAARIVISNARTVGPPSCSGCDGAACLVLNSILVRRPPRPAGAPSSDILVTAPGAGSANWAGWQALSGGDCAAVPVKNRTWGEVKSLYR